MATISTTKKSFANQRNKTVISHKSAQQNNANECNKRKSALQISHEKITATKKSYANQRNKTVLLRKSAQHKKTLCILLCVYMCVSLVTH